MALYPPDPECVYCKGEGFRWVRNGDEKFDDDCYCTWNASEVDVGE